MRGISGHVSSERLGEAASHGDLSFLRDAEQRHVRDCDRCRRLYGGYRLTDRLLCAPWREVRLPEPAAPASRWAALGPRLSGAFSGVETRRLAPGLAALAILALVAGALGLPRLISVPPAASPSPIADLSPTASPQVSDEATPTSGAPTPSPTPSATPSGSAGASAGASATPATSQASAPAATPLSLALARLVGTPIAWSPDGAHLLVAAGGSSRTIQIRDAAGRVTGSLTADGAVWVDSTTIAFTSRSLTPAATPTSTQPAQPSSPAPTPVPKPSGLRHGIYPNSGASSSPGNAGGNVGGNAPGGVPGGAKPESVALADLYGNVASVLPGSYSQWASIPNGQLLGSGSGELTVVSQNGPGAGWQYELWATSGGLHRMGSGSGVPIAFSRDGSRLAVLHPTAALGAGIVGWLEVVSVPGLGSQVSFSKPPLRVGGGSLGSAYGFDATFSPDGRSLLVSGVLVNLANGATIATGKGGWTADGHLVTGSASGLLRWNGSASAADSRFSGSGRAMVSRHGELIYLFDNGQALLLTTTGRLVSLSVPSVRTIAHLLISPNGRAIALDGRATDGTSIAAVAPLPSP